ncbi:SH3 domain-containing protein [Planktotalea frisia]|jgi:hypothetical protein|uniref:Bacterial SH3 domain protein n=1 Tax=Planktotalea frisia TaxID=696762 RepID=A0A1L9P0P1_9RHOB|nr:SH3 domain-containing protein [Planktotalea frisia]OJI95051.1 bacterial SH3 domain protein [Planktotalea frisia]PZX31600.1 SH3 domain-containing protein [Planktotalea frisia]
MGKIIVITFAFMAFAFYELSGGCEFVAIADEKRAALAIEQAEEQRLIAQTKAERLKTQPEAQVVLASATVSTSGTVVQENAATTPLVEEEKIEAVTEVAAVLETVVEEEPAADMRKVTAARVNMRQGPGQNFSVVAKLNNGDEVEILQDPGDGWVKLKVMDSGRIGWMADFLLTASNI